MDLPSANEIRYFMEIASTQNFTRAAERLGISQPTLTSAIRNLEHQLEVARDLIDKWVDIKKRSKNFSRDCF